MPTNNRLSSSLAAASLGALLLASCSDSDGQEAASLGLTPAAPAPTAAPVAPTPAAPTQAVMPVAPTPVAAPVTSEVPSAPPAPVPTMETPAAGGSTAMTPVEMNDPVGSAGAEGVGGAGNTGVALPESASAGCMAAEPLHMGERTVEDMVTFDGGEQPYRILLPTGYGEEQKAWPLVFALHPNNQHMGLNFWNDVDGDTNNEVMPEIIPAADGRAIVITPSSFRRGDGNQVWNQEQHLDPHLAMFDELFEIAKRDLCIDTERVYSMGHSGGASFSAILGCRREYIKAIGVNSGAWYFNTDDAVTGGGCVGSADAWVAFGQEENRGSIRDAYRQMHGCDAADPDFGDDPPCVDLTCDDGRMRHCRSAGGHAWVDWVSEDILDFFLGPQL